MKLPGGAPTVAVLIGRVGGGRAVVVAVVAVHAVAVQMLTDHCLVLYVGIVAEEFFTTT